MIAVVQRVGSARVTVAGDVTGEIQRGLLVLLGVARGDEAADADYLVRKMLGLRIFPDEDDRMNRSIIDIGGSILIVSQFTLLADCSKGNRPSFEEAAPPEEARTLYEYFVKRVRDTGLATQTGRFQAAMSLESLNDGPVTIIIESTRKKV